MVVVIAILLLYYSAMAQRGVYVYDLWMSKQVVVLWLGRGCTLWRYVADANAQFNSGRPKRRRAAK